MTDTGRQSFTQEERRRALETATRIARQKMDADRRARDDKHEASAGQACR